MIGLEQDGTGFVHPGRTEEKTQGGENSGVGRDDHSGHVEGAGKGGGVEAAGATEGHERRLAGVGAQLDGDPAQGAPAMISSTTLTTPRAVWGTSRSS